jgi:murein DD-endopeptidase MepM/ murein hydrolase activator NlpD
VRGVRRSAIADTFDAPRGPRRHHAVDILAPRGTAVLAATAGRIARLSRSRGGGLELYLLDDTSRYCLYYAHLLRYARGLREGGSVSQGAVLAYVGASGNAPLRAPHLHFAVTRSAAPGRCDGEDLNPLDLMR